MCNVEAFLNIYMRMLMIVNYLWLFMLFYRWLYPHTFYLTTLLKARESQSFEQLVWTFSYSNSFISILIDLCTQLTSSGELQKVYTGTLSFLFSLTFLFIRMIEYVQMCLYAFMFVYIFMKVCFLFVVIDIWFERMSWSTLIKFAWKWIINWIIS